MIYLDNGATSFRKPDAVSKAMVQAIRDCANPGRGGYKESLAAAKTVYQCRELAALIFDAEPEQVVFTANCTQGLNIAIRTLVKPGKKVVISGFEHNAVTRTLKHLGADVTIAGRKLFDWKDTLESFEQVLKGGTDAAIFTHVSNVFGYVLPVEKMCALCRKYKTPFIVDAAQSAGIYPVKLKQWGADFVAMPGHKGLLGPQGTGILLCGRLPEAMICGGTGSDSILQEMPAYLPDRGEAGTLNVPGIAGLGAGLGYLQMAGIQNIAQRESKAADRCAQGLKSLGFAVYSGIHQGGTVSFVPDRDCEEAAQFFADRDIAVRAGLHCAPLAHESAGTLKTGTVRVSVGYDTPMWQIDAFLEVAAGIKNGIS